MSKTEISQGKRGQTSGHSVWLAMTKLRRPPAVSRDRLPGALLLAGALLFASTATARGGEYEVKKGDTLWDIARQHHVRVDDLREANDLTKGKPIRPGQLLVIPGKGGTQRAKRDAGDQSRDKGSDTWVAKKPASATQVQKSAKERGINPCNTPDPGFGIYDRWSRGLTTGQMIAPQRGGVTGSGRFDVMVHFHGHEPIRKEWVQVMEGPVLVGVDLGVGSGPYAAAFADPSAFERLIKSVEAEVAEKTGKKNARARKIGISGWSAGYGAIGEIINSRFGQQRVDSVILLDGLHSGYSGKSLNSAQLKPFTDFAERAARGDRLMFVSHSSIIPPGYASTTETANFLIHRLGGKPRKTRPRNGDPMGLDLLSRYTNGTFHVRGYAGNSTLDHCAHIGLYRDVLKVHVKPRWNSPRGYKKKG